MVSYGIIMSLSQRKEKPETPLFEHTVSIPAKCIDPYQRTKVGFSVRSLGRLIHTETEYDLAEIEPAKRVARRFHPQNFTAKTRSIVESRNGNGTAPKRAAPAPFLDSTRQSAFWIQALYKYRPTHAASGSPVYPANHDARARVNPLKS
jgi:hypothetical protein